MICFYNYIGQTFRPSINYTIYMSYHLTRKELPIDIFLLATAR